MLNLKQKNGFRVLLSGLVVACLSLFIATSLSFARNINNPDYESSAVIADKTTLQTTGENEIIRTQTTREGRSAYPLIENKEIGQEVQKPLESDKNVIDVYISELPKDISLYDSKTALVKQTVECMLMPGKNEIFLNDLPQSVDISTVELISTNDKIDIVSKKTVSGEFALTAPVWTINSQEEGSFSFIITYLLDGLEWSVDYSVMILDDGQKANFAGSLSITNLTDANLSNAFIGLVSSDISFPGEVINHPLAYTMGFKCYELDGSVDILPYSILSIDLCRENNLIAETRYTIKDTASAVSAQIGIKQIMPVDFDLVISSATEGEKIADKNLPEGNVKIFVKSVDDVVFLLYNEKLGPVSCDSDSIEFKLGNAPEIYAEILCTDKKKVGTSSWEDAYQLSFHNVYNPEMTVSFIKDFPADWTILQSAPSGWSKTAEGKAELNVAAKDFENVPILFKVRYTFLEQ